MGIVETSMSGAVIGLVAGLFCILARSIGRARWDRLGPRLLGGGAGGAIGGAVGGLIHALIVPGAPIFFEFLLPLACITFGAGIGAMLSSAEEIHRPNRVGRPEEE